MNNKVAVIVIAVLILGGGILYLYKNQMAYKSPAAPTLTPISTPTQSLDKSAKEVTVEITASGFQPKAVTIKADTKVVWVNKSGATVSINSADHPTHLVYPPLNLGVVEDGNSASLVFDTVGTFKYHNHLNPSQTGTIVVE